MNGCIGDSRADPSLEKADFFLRQGVGFGDDRDKIDLRVEPPHELDVDWFQPSSDNKQ